MNNACVLATLKNGQVVTAQGVTLMALLATLIESRGHDLAKVELYNRFAPAPSSDSILREFLRIRGFEGLL